MATPEIDQTIPLNFHRVEQRERHGYQEAFCATCGAWVRIGKHYKADRLVIRAIPHIYPCSNLEDFVKDWASGVWRIE